MFPLPLPSFAALLIAASALPAPIPPQQQLAYRLPSPPTATYCFFLWDVARGLPVYAEVSRAYEGEMTIPGEGSMDIKATAATRMRLEN